MRHRRDVVCQSCEYPDDLEWFDGRLLCLACRTCEHGCVGVETLQSLHRNCPLCLREYFTAWSFLGPMLVTPERYFDYAENIDIDPYSLLTWSSREEDALLKWASAQKG